MKSNVIKTGLYSSPCGELVIGEYCGRLCLCDWVKDSRSVLGSRLLKRLDAVCEEMPSDIVDAVIVMLDEYFSGHRITFDIPVLFTGTEFQESVWKELSTIPYGTTISYYELACRIGNPKAVRAVASANRANPISIIVPCHRVIGLNGRLTGYGGGLPAKEFLLRLENAL